MAQLSQRLLTSEPPYVPCSPVYVYTDSQQAADLETLASIIPQTPLMEALDCLLSPLPHLDDKDNNHYIPQTPVLDSLIPNPPEQDAVPIVEDVVGVAVDLPKKKSKEGQKRRHKEKEHRKVAEKGEISHEKGWSIKKFVALHITKNAEGEFLSMEALVTKADNRSIKKAIWVTKETCNEFRKRALNFLHNGRPAETITPLVVREKTHEFYIRKDARLEGHLQDILTKRRAAI